MPNEPVRYAWADAASFLVSVDDVETETGLDLLAKLPNRRENALEAEVASAPWP